MYGSPSPFTLNKVVVRRHGEKHRDDTSVKRRHCLSVSNWLRSAELTNGCVQAAPLTSPSLGVTTTLALAL